MFFVRKSAVKISRAFRGEKSRKETPFDIGSTIYTEDRSGELPMYYPKDAVVKHTISLRMKSPEEVHYYQDTCTGSTKTERHEESRKTESTEATSEDLTTPQDDPKLEKEQSAGQNESQTQATDREEDHTDAEECDLIHLEKHGITVTISKYEIYSAKDITVEVIEDVPPELELKETEAIISVGLKMSPSDAAFSAPVRVTMPHCGVFTKPKDAEVYIYYRKNASTGFTSIQSTNTSCPRCVVRERDLDIYVDHFSEHWIVALIKRTFIGKRVICTTYIPVSTPRNGIHVVYVHVRDEDVVEEVCINKAERFSRRNNVRLVGKPETADEDCIGIVQNIISEKFGINPRIERAHRDGKPSTDPDHPRHILFKLLSFRDKVAIMKSARSTLANESYFVVDDLTKEDLAEKRRYSQEVKRLYQQGTKLKFTAGKWRHRDGTTFDFTQTCQAEAEL
ncbi:uncharacterized protein LOC129283319 [Lytechinus pictus]|uniref:uncharacterized protein LOC129283319 n=1 Tax=Lytechinus pictus TaxID=7653 RepID=UPI0030BA24EF